MFSCQMFSDLKSDVFMPPLKILCLHLKCEDDLSLHHLNRVDGCCTDLPYGWLFYRSMDAMLQLILLFMQGVRPVGGGWCKEWRPEGGDGGYEDVNLCMSVFYTSTFSG